MDTRFKGKIRFRGTLRIDGHVDGTIVSDEGSGSVLVVNQHAVVTGNIISDSVLISGRVLGNIKAAQRVEIFRTGNLKGDVLTNDIVIQGGAEYEGNCRMIRNDNGDRKDKAPGGGMGFTEGTAKSHGKPVAGGAAAAGDAPPA